MTVINEENREKKVNFDEKGKFCKGNTISGNRRNRSQTEKLMTALNKAGKKGCDNNAKDRKNRVRYIGEYQRNYTD